MAREVKIVVKNVYVPAELQQFIVEETALVRHLKQRVHEQFPGNPLPAHQKLIFGGKICADSDPLLKILNVNQVQSEECVEEATAVVFHLLVTSVPPRSGPSTPPAGAKPTVATSPQSAPVSAPSAPAAAPSPAAPTLSPLSPDMSSTTDRAAIDSPRPAPISRSVAPPLLDISSPQAASRGATQHPQAAHFTFPAFGHFADRPAAAAAAAAAAPAPHGTHAPPQQHHDLFTQGMLMHQQAMVLAQIQYLQYLKTHYQHAGGAQHGQHGQHGVASSTPTAAANPQAHQHQHQQFAQYPQFGHYFGMGMHHPQLYNAMHGMHHPGVHPVGAAAAIGAGFPHAHAHVHAATAPAPAAAAAAAPRPNPLIVQIAREILPLFDIRLAMKMAFMLFIIGQDTPNDRVLMLALLSFISYLHITGILAKIYEVYKRHYAPPVDPNGDENRAEGGANNNGNNGNNANNGAGRLNGVAAGLARVDFTRVLRISSDRGFVQDVKYFFVGFLLSLVPAWHPQPLHGVTGAAPPVQDLPDVAEMPVQGI